MGFEHEHTFTRSDVYCDGCGGYYDDVLPVDEIQSVPRVLAKSAVARYRTRYA